MPIEVFSLAGVAVADWVAPSGSGSPVAGGLFGKIHSTTDVRVALADVGSITMPNAMTSASIIVSALRDILLFLLIIFMSFLCLIMKCFKDES